MPLLALLSSPALAGRAAGVVVPLLAQAKTPGTLPGNPASEMLQELQNLEQACGSDPSWVCERVLEATGSQRWAGFAEWFVAKPLAIGLVILGAVIVSRVLRRIIKRSMQRLLDADTPRLLQRAPAVLRRTEENNLRAQARVQSLTTVFRSLTSIVVWFVAVIWILEILHIDLAPLVASAGIIGVALGFGAQNVVRDFLAGTFILLEDQLGVGDVVDLGEAKGTVEAITLRSTRVRDVHGVLWHVPNGQIQRVANKSQQWARALLDVDVDIDTDYEQARGVILHTAEVLAADPDWVGSVLDSPEVWGIEAFGRDVYTIRVVVKTPPAAQFALLRELRIRLKAAFDEAGIHLATEHPDRWSAAD